MSERAAGEAATASVLHQWDVPGLGTNGHARIVAKAGHSTTIVGANGAGKSALGLWMGQNPMAVSQGYAGRVDWRTDYDSHTYETIELPRPVRDRLAALHRELGLTYGACDIALDSKGDWVFFETNPGGEWGWLAEECQVPAASVLAGILEKGRA